MQSLANDVDKIRKSLHSLWAATEHNSLAINEMRDMIGSLSKQIQEQPFKSQYQYELQQPSEIEEQESTTIQKDQSEKHAFTNLPYHQEQCTTFNTNSGKYQLTHLPALSSEIVLCISLMMLVIVLRNVFDWNLPWMEYGSIDWNEEASIIKGVRISKNNEVGNVQRSEE